MAPRMLLSWCSGKEIIIKGFWAGLLLFFVLACKFLAWAQNPTNSVFTPPPAATDSACENPFGLMLGAPGMTLEQRLRLVKDLGAVYFRPNAVRIANWDGTCAECEAAQRAGLKLILTVSNSGGPGQPSRPPTDLTTYKRTLEAILNKYRPEVLVVENEENSRLFYLGAPEEYQTELHAACSQAHKMGIPCTNGGLVSTLVALLVYDHYVQRGNLAKARSFAERTFSPEERRLLGSSRAREQIQKGKALLKAYVAAQADYVNFHWYIADPTALSEAVQFLKEATGLPVMTNEIGQHDLSPTTVTSMMNEVVRLKLPFAVWFSIDAARAYALMNSDGTLRENGKAFQQFIQLFCAPTATRHSSPAPLAAKATHMPVTTAVVSPVFGVHVNFSRKTMPDAAVIRSLGARVTTLWLYPAPGGRFNINQARRLVNMIQEQTGGMDIYIHLMPNARSEAMGATGVGDPELPKNGAGFTLPGDMNTYLASVRELATALKGSVTYYSIGNEVSGFSWKGTVQDYGTLLAQSATAIKSVDPNAKILDSGMAGLSYAFTIPNTLYQAGKTAEAIEFFKRYTQNHIGFLRQFLPIDNEAHVQAVLADPGVQKTLHLSAARFKEYCPFYDIFQLHDYQGWETMEEVYDWIHEQMRANNCIKPIQVWEIGYGLDKNLPYDVTEHARTVTRILTISAAAGAQTVIYFPLSERGGFARPLLGSNNEIQPPAIAYQVTVAKLADATSAEKLHLAPGVWVYRFGRKNGKDVYVLWGTASKTVRLPIDASRVTVTDQTGRTTTASPSALQIGVDPIFVEAK